MLTQDKVLQDMMELDRLRGVAVRMAENRNPLASVVLAACDAGDESCRAYNRMYSYLRKHPEEFGSSKVRRWFLKNVQPLECRAQEVHEVVRKCCRAMVEEG